MTGILYIKKLLEKILTRLTSIGTVVTAYMPDALSAQTSTWYTICEAELSAGVWIVSCCVRWGGNATGTRVAHLAADNTGAYWNYSIAPNSADTCQGQFTSIKTITQDTTFYLRAYQTSGSTLTMGAGSSDGTVNGFRAVKIK